MCSMIGDVLQDVAGLAERAVVPVGGSVDALRQAGTLRESAHRPWPLPRRPWLMGQTWSTLLFAHWPLPVAELRRVVPEQIPIDTFDGSAWLGVTPFELSGARLRGTLPPPGLSRFPECNVRTYTTIGGKPGIWFLSLDAGSRLAVETARRLYRLPYFHAAMRVGREDHEGRERVTYRSRRISRDGPRAELAGFYGPDGALSTARAGTLEHFLTERYCLYALDEALAVHRAELHHPPWPLQPATGDFAVNTMALPLGIGLPRRPPLLHYAHRQDVTIWSLERVTDA